MQLADLDPNNNLGPRLTATVTSNKLSGNHLFASIGSKITLIDAVSSPPIAYEFASDPMWNRVVFGQKDVYIYGFKNAGSSLVPLQGPGGIDVSASRILFVADRMNIRVLLARFDPQARTITQVAVTPDDPDLYGMTDVKWDGGTSPLTTNNFYALDGTGRVSYWQWTSGTPVKLWAFGAAGSSVGQFNGPRGICVGHTAASNGGSVFTSDFYVTDVGNRRVVWLQRAASGATWMSAVTLPDNGLPADCTVDHFGNVTVADSRNSRLLKYTWNLALLASYGTYGVGATNDNTFAHPHAVHAPFGTKKNSSGQTVWYGEGRVLTAEDWGAQSGAREHYLGLTASVSGPYTSTPAATMTDSATDHAYHYVTVLDWNRATVRFLANMVLLPPGSASWYWDGRRDDGTWAAPGNYQFFVYVTSAYGCGASWCQGTFYSSTFWWNGQTCSPPPGAAPALPCQPSAARDSFLSGEAVPATLFLHQRVVTDPRPLARTTMPEPAAPAAPTGPPFGGLVEAVRQHGVRGLSFSVTRAAAVAPVEIRVYSMSGRLIRTLVAQRLDAGVYEIGWDGNDDQGRPASPGVYVAVMTAGSYSAKQRLILRQP